MIEVTDKRKEDLDVINTDRKSKNGCFIFGYQKDYVDKLIDRDNAKFMYVSVSDDMTECICKCPICGYERIIKVESKDDDISSDIPKFCQRCGKRLMFDNK